MGDVTDAQVPARTALTGSGHIPSLLNGASGMTLAPVRPRCTRGALVSVEGINGVGKTFLTQRVIEALDNQPLNLDGASRQKNGRPGLGGALLRALHKASGGDPFLRGGTPMAEAMLLLAIKRHDLEGVLPELRAGRSVLEGRCVDTTAVCHGLAWRPEDLDAALETALALLDLAACYRPLPDLTILVTDGISRAIERVQERDQRAFTPEQARFVREAYVLHEWIAASDPARYRVLDRRRCDESEATERIRAWIHELRTGLGCVREPWQSPDADCMYCGRPGEVA